LVDQSQIKQTRWKKTEKNNKSILVKIYKRYGELRPLLKYVININQSEKLEWKVLIEKLDHDNEYVKNRLIDLFLSNSINMAYKYAKKYNLDLPDTIQTAIEGLVKAINDYDKTKNVVFLSYISRATIHHLMKNIYFPKNSLYYPTGLKKEIMLIQRLLREFNCELCSLDNSCSKHTRTEVRCSKFSIEKITKLVKSAYKILYLDEVDDIDNYLISCELSNNQYMILEQKELGTILSQIIDTLSEKQQTIINKRYGLIKYEKSTLEGIAKELNVTRENIRQIEKKAIKIIAQKLREIYYI